MQDTFSQRFIHNLLKENMKNILKDKQIEIKDDFFMFPVTYPRKNSKIIALYGDGGGCQIFKICDDLTILDSEGIEMGIDLDWFFDAGFLYFTYIPDSINYKFWFEQD